jgi:hypothetical protein
MMPRSYKIDNFGPLKVGMKQLHEMACAFAEEEFGRRGKIPFLWLIAADTRVFWLETNWENDREKEMHLFIVKQFMQQVKARAYTSMVEAWVSTYGKGEIGPDGEIPDGLVLPSNQPKTNRDDVLWVSTEDDAGNSLFTRYLVTLRPHGNNYLGPRVDDDIKGLKGTMLNMLVG